jgi:thiol:disulfide interchange protein
MILETKITNREELKHILKNENPGVIIIKFSATWCGPCKLIDNFVKNKLSNLPQTTINVLKIDIDEAFDIYGFLKTKKVLKGVPTILAYFQGNLECFPDDMVSGTNETEISAFFARCIEQV